MSVVLQEPYLFSGTVRDNIRYNRTDATNEEVVRAAKAVEAHDFIVELEDSYETHLQERGGNLSVGQRQLISFARALVADPRILILDEATANIDTYTELLIQGAIKELLKGRTALVIAHRLSTVRNAGRIVVVDGAASSNRVPTTSSWLRADTIPGSRATQLTGLRVGALPDRATGSRVAGTHVWD